MHWYFLSSVSSFTLSHLYINIIFLCFYYPSSPEFFLLQVCFHPMGISIWKELWCVHFKSSQGLHTSRSFRLSDNSLEATWKQVYNPPISIPALSRIICCSFLSRPWWHFGRSLLLGPPCHLYRYQMGLVNVCALSPLA